MLTLRLKRDVLTELGPDDLQSVVAAAPAPSYPVTGCLSAVDTCDSIRACVSTGGTTR